MPDIAAAPAGADHVSTVSEDAAYTLAAADFGFTDSDGDTFAAVEISTLPAAGALTLDADGVGSDAPVAVTAGQVISAADLAAGKLVFTPAADASGAAYASFTFQVQDSGNTANGGSNTDPTPNTLTFDVTAINDAPAGANHVSTVFEDAAYTLAAADFGFTDSDGDTFAAVEISTLPAAGALTLDADGVGSDAPVAVTAGQVISAADLAAGKLVFTPAADASGAAYASFTFQVQDSGNTANGGSNTDPTPNTLTFDVTAINDAPAGANHVSTVFEDAAYTLAAADFGFTDSDGDTFAAVEISTLPAAGALTLDADGVGSDAPVAVTAGQVISAADLAAGKLVFTPAADASGAAYASFTFQVQDSGNTANGGSNTDPTPNTLTFDVTAINDAPGAANLEGDVATFTVGGSAVALDTGHDASVSDADHMGFRVDRVGTGFKLLDFMLPDPRDPQRLFVAQLNGIIKILDTTYNTDVKQTFLDISKDVLMGGERGFSSFAFSPDYAETGEFYAFFTNLSGDNEVRRYHSTKASPDAVDPTTAETIITIPHSQETSHNGGWIGFGPDGYLYVTTGDAAEDKSQDLTSLDGKILRLDVSRDNYSDPKRNYAIPLDNPFQSDGALPEIWASGLRNPYRASFDPVTGDLYIGDVGEAIAEEINVVPAGNGGLDFGWPSAEGAAAHAHLSGTSAGTMPVIEYLHASAHTGYVPAAVTGGIVYRGPIEALTNEYIFADVYGSIWSVPLSLLSQGSTVDRSSFRLLTTAFKPQEGLPYTITSITQSDDGSIYLNNMFAGEVFRISSSTTSNFAGGNLVVTIKDGVSSEDSIIIQPSDPRISLTDQSKPGSYIFVDGKIVGKVGSSANPGDLAIYWTGGATQDRVDAVVHALAYYNSDQTSPSLADRHITFTFEDGGRTASGGFSHLTATTIVKVAVPIVNHAPAGANHVSTVFEDAAYTLAAADFGFTDSDGDTFAAVEISTLPAAGALTLDADGVGSDAPVAVTAGQVISAADLAAGKLVFTPAADASGAAYASFTFQVQDSGNTANGGSNTDPTPNTLTFQVFDGLSYIASYPDLSAAFGTDGHAGSMHYRSAGKAEGRIVSFDPLRYGASNPDVAALYGLDGPALAQHYILEGAAQHLSTTAFDPYEYAASNPSLIATLGSDEFAIVEHYLDQGRAAGLLTNSFDAMLYAASNPDLLGSISATPAALAKHYVEVGYAEDRPTSGFDALEYAASNPDLARAYGTNVVGLTQHFASWGHAEGRSTTSFDVLKYAGSNPIVVESVGLDRQALLKHYIEEGLAQNLSTTAFDPYEYAASNPSLIATLGSDEFAIVEHYLDQGRAAGLLTNSFDAMLYAASNPDLLGSISATPAALAKHYVEVGYAEDRPTSGFDALEYAASNPDLARAYGTNVVGLTQHFASWGHAEGRSTTSFDVLKYAGSNPIVVESVGLDRQALLKHYIEEGLAQNLSTTAFDPYEYAASNPSLIATLGSDEFAIVEHYLDQGRAAGLLTNSFDAMLYAASNPDLLGSISATPAALAKHYVEVGYAEDRPTSGFDAVAYLITNRDLARAHMTAEEATSHWVNYGYAEGRSAHGLFGNEQESHSIDLARHEAVEQQGDRDWFAFDLSPGDHVSVYMNGSSSETGTLENGFIALYDEHGLLIAEDHTGGMGNYPRISLESVEGGHFYAVTGSTDGGTGTYHIGLDWGW